MCPALFSSKLKQDKGSSTCITFLQKMRRGGVKRVKIPQQWVQLPVGNKHIEFNVESIKALSFEPKGGAEWNQIKYDIKVTYGVSTSRDMKGGRDMKELI